MKQRHISQLYPVVALELFLHPLEKIESHHSHFGEVVGMDVDPEA
jgi:hypothetical protein